MISATKRSWFARWLARDARRRLRRSFGSLRAAGLDDVRPLLCSGSVVFVANHTSWWDALVILHLAEHLLHTDGYAVMDEANLKSLRFFGWAGAIGVRLGSKRDGARVLRHCASLLDRPGRSVWMFPQGEERPPREPLAFAPGAARIATLAGVPVIPVGLAYVHGPRPRPDLYVAFGTPLRATGSVSSHVRRQEAAVHQALERIDGELSTPGAFGFGCVWHRRQSVLGSLAQRALDGVVGWLGGLPSSDQPAALVEHQGTAPPANPTAPQRAQASHQ